VLKSLLFGESVGVHNTRSFSFFQKSIENTILTNKRNSNAKDRNCIFDEILKLYLQNSFEENLKIVL